MHFFQRRHLSPLILLFIFITSFNGSLGRHRIRHHRDRFKRQQGAHLYLPESYVSDGGTEPDGGPWQEWSTPSSCSRSCGGGVSTQVRQCTPGYACQGPTSKHFSCNTQDCPDTGDFREQQCAEFNSVPFEGINYDWIPYTKAPNPCELNCMPRGERFYYRHREQVIDGTRCNDETLDVCVQGKCHPVGCDMMLGSSAREDRCRTCGGDGSTCNTVTGVLDMQDLQAGYNDILLIPRGATNIVVEEREPSNNYLAIRNTTGHYYLNGNWRIDFPRTMDFAGCKFHYERYPQGFSAPDRITCLGPIDEAVFVVLLYQDRNVGVNYEYSLPTNIQAQDNETYVWTFDQFTPCSASCGGGVQYRNVTCAGRKTLDPVDRNLCDSNNEPASSQRCGEVPCDAQWVPYPWNNCSAPCGEQGGVQTREIACQQVIAGGYPSLVDPALCASQPKPPQQQACNQGRVCAQWHVGPWKPCDHLCGDGVETRQIRCYKKDGDKIEVLDDSQCTDPKPETRKRCNLRPCEGVDWITSEWSTCDKCGLTNETRQVKCATADGTIYADDLCEEEQKPAAVRECKTVNASCDYAWYASQWSECSAQCGQGVQTRVLFCGVVAPDGSVKKVEEDKCGDNKRYDTIKNCTGELEKCPGEWFSGPWADCSKPCGGGERSRKVVCLKDLVVVNPSECGSDKIIFSKEECNSEACSEDTIIPTDVTKPVDETDKETKVTEPSVSDVTEPKESPITDVTETKETSTEPSAVDDEEYEIVPDDECDDGEWVDDEESEDLKETEASEASDKLGSSTEPSTGSSETGFSLDDLMLSDSPSSPEESDTTITGSGEGELTSPSTDLTESTVEGSGESEGTIVTDIFETDTAITLESSPEGSEGTETTTEGNTEVTSTSDSSSTEITSESSTDSSTISESTSEESSSSSSDVTSESSSVGSTESSSSESTETSETTDSTESTESTPTTDSTESTPTTDSTESTPTTDTTESTQTTDSTESTPTTDSTESTPTTETSVSTSTDISSTSESTDSTTTESGSTTTESGATTELTSIAATEETEPQIVESDLGGKPVSTTEKSSSSESTESSRESTDTTESTTEVTVSTESTPASESTTEFTGSTESTPETESTIDFTGTTETPGSTESTTEFTGSTEFDIWSSTTEVSSPSSDLWETTPIIDIFKPKGLRMCKRKKQKDCKSTPFGCCWDKITPAEGPFDKDCPTPETCKESKFGCCEDGVSPALGKKFKGCPSTHCNETLFGCCPDNKTAAEGENKEGCPPPPPACLKSKYGCCKDNVTEAKGAKNKDCEKEVPATAKVVEGCENSTHGCCPDRLTKAEGPNYKGCKMPCSDDPYGCCPDGVTPAHGYSGEGCCLTGPYGCCPDNIVHARGPNLEGCGCQYSPYGCCPDNSTVARGHNSEGCGCQYTENGCCPDDYTPADSPDYRGCLCHTFQFGCCPDGTTIAKGPHQQGCGCRNTEFGCCSDDRTPAQGPNFAGCGCDASKYGCCPDGTTEAKGDGFEGCEDVPSDLQENCLQPRERGPCRNYTVKWFFDMDYGGCSRFWYGGCEGTKNRFKSKEECDGVCVKPDGIDRCKLPKVPGPCEGYYPQWHYDKERKVCSQFIYGGCLGNNNKFETREECTALCVTDDSGDACEQKKVEGPCKGNYRRWYFDKDSKSCQQFAYGGCKGNSNSFATEEACKQQCAQPGRKKDHCSLPRAQGNCTDREPRWYFDIPEKRCLPFYYSGCNGNDNNFNSREACESDCPKEIEKDVCHLAADVGNCANYAERWYFDTREKTCRQFYYGGCGGNENNFETKDQCEQRCERRQVQQPPTSPPDSRGQEPFTTDMCFLPNDNGPCSAFDVRYYYDRDDGVCKSFNYGGCGGNRNNFGAAEECLQYCGNAQDLCTLPPIVGACNGEYEEYYYDSRTDSCQSFNYGGCGGNYNRFQDKASCEQRCRRSPPEEPVQTQAPPVQTVDVPLCNEPADPGNCTDNLSVFFYDVNTGTCTPFTYTGCGGNGNRFTSEEQCERQCGSFRSQDVCNMDKDSGPCRGYFVKYYYEKSRGQCGQFAYGGCAGNGNRFSSSEECESICVKKQETKSNLTSTSLSPEDHPCQAHFDECTSLRCPYGIEAYVDENQCNRCQCQNPCKQVNCPEGSQCAIDINRNKTTAADADFIAVCREVNKEGECPTLQPSDSNCEQECRNDADCALQLKCCTAGCSTACVEPVIEIPASLVTQGYLPAYTESPLQAEYAPPKVDVQTFEPEVHGLLGDQITIRCAVTGNPVPQISWKKDNLLIDGTQAKYRIKLDQSLQIITLHKTDSGVYLCTADNTIGEPITNQIRLEVVDDGNTRPANVLDPEDQPANDVVVSLNAPATLNCLALGYPFPAVTWWKDDTMIPLKTSQFEVRRDYSLLIHSVKLSNLGIYTCQAYNGIGKAASWSVTVKAKGPYHSTNPKDEQFLRYIVNPPELPTTTEAPREVPQYFRPQYPYPPPENNEIRPEIPPVPQPPPYIVPVRTNISLEAQRFPTNSDISIPCVVEGFPIPQVQWYKDGVPLNPSSRHQISESHRLTIQRASKADSGLYQCEAANAYSKSSSTVSILVDGMYIHPNCKDNRFFANCDLIVKAKFCSHKYYAKFCCRSCTEAGLLPVDGAHLQYDKQSALSSNLI